MCRHLIAALALTMLVPCAWAYKPAPRISHTTTSPDGQHIFVMLSTESMEDELKHWNEETQAQVRSIRQTWQKSGMYRNDGSKEPLWTVDWYAYQLDVPLGGEYVVRYNAGGWNWQQFPALAFYRHGELIRSYAISELVTFPYLIDHGGWLAEKHLTDESQTIAVTTESGERYVFDVRTGEMVSRFRPLRYVVVGTVVATTLIGIWLVRRRRLKRVVVISE